MEVLDVKIDLFKQGLKKDDSWNHEMLTDAHVGHPNFAKKEFQKAIERIATDPSRSTHFNGDITDNLPPTHKWFDQVQANPAMLEAVQQMAYFWKLINPLVQAHEKTGNKILGFLEGNHEYNRGITSTAFQYAYCKPELDDDGKIVNLKYNYLGYAAYIGFHFFWKGEHVRSFSMLVSHGSYNGDQRGGDMNNMARSPASYEADIRLEGHSHDKWFVVNPYYDVTLTKDYKLQPVEAERFIGNGGCFLRGSIVGRNTPSGYVVGHNSYNEKRIFRGRVASIGTITVGMNPYTGKLNGHL